MQYRLTTCSDIIIIFNFIPVIAFEQNKIFLIHIENTRGSVGWAGVAHI
jgi:hypothetical protein